MSSNTPQNLGTPIVGSKMKKTNKGYCHLDKFRLRLRSACRCLNNQDAVPTAPQWNQTSWRKTCPCCVKSPKTQERQRSEESSAMQEKSLNFKTALKKYDKSNKTRGTNYNFQCYREKSRFLLDMPSYGEPRPLQGSHVPVEAPHCIHVGKVRVFEPGLVSYHQYEVLCRLWGGLLKQPQALCEFDRPFMFILALLVCVHWDEKDPTHLMTKVCPRKKKVKIISRQVKGLQRQTLTFTISFIFLNYFALHRF